jgi:transcriptional pleiotropic repressor
LKKLCAQLCNITNANIYLFNSNGRIFSYSTSESYYCAYNEKALKDPELPQHFLDMFNESDDMRFNLYEECPTCTCSGVESCIFKDRYYSIVPVFCNFAKIAGILMIRYDSPFASDEEVLCEHTATIISLELMRREQERTKKRSFEIAQAHLAVCSLTFSELKAVSSILDMLPEKEGVIFLNAVSKETYVTQSTASSALKKMESAGVMQTKSQGVKGKYVNIVNNYLDEEVKAALNSLNQDSL